MDTKKFEAAERLLIWDAKCPEDVFGDMPKVKKDFDRKIKEKIQEINLATQDPKDDNQKYRVERVLEQFLGFTDWALNAFKHGLYGKRMLYRTMIRLSVQKYYGKPRFFLEDCPRKNIYLDEVSAVHFEGYMQHDTVRVVRKGKTIHKGCVIYYGTHAAQEYFDLGGMRSRLAAIDFRVGDCIEIEATKIRSVSDFAKHLIGFYQIASALKSAFAKNDNKLSGKQLKSTVKSANKETVRTVKTRKTFLLIDPD